MLGRDAFQNSGTYRNVLKTRKRGYIWQRESNIDMSGGQIWIAILWALETCVELTPISTPFDPHFINPLAPGEILDIFKQIFSNWWLRQLLWNCPIMNVTGLYWWSVNIGSGNGLVPWGKSHFLSQCCPRSLSPYGVTRPQWNLTQWPLGDSKKI